MIEDEKFKMELVRVLENHVGIDMGYAPSTNSLKVLEGVTYYSLAIAVAGVILILGGIIWAGMDLRRKGTNGFQ